MVANAQSDLELHDAWTAPYLYLFILCLATVAYADKEPTIIGLMSLWQTLETPVQIIYDIFFTIALITP